MSKNWLSVTFCWNYAYLSFDNSMYVTISNGAFNNSIASTQSFNICTSHILLLREENEKLKQELDLFKNKNTELQLYVNTLSGQCGSIQQCKAEDTLYADGIFGIQILVRLVDVRHSVQCSCPDGFSGPLCEQSITSCTPIQTDDHCNHTQALWYFDSYSNQCKSTITGCFEVRTTFLTFEECSSSCLQGTCCYRMKIGEIPDMICQPETMKNCQMLCQDANIEVLGYYPGIKCPNEGCGMIASKVCHTGISLYSPGSTFSFGCETCQCF
ncbi:hypothetical protein CEXT_250941 [Caerostris extrusa]|uniref:Uncharacterized protein n=1 Tax=Caerostris extrusa TaxID=172846 RepID=A0AAV4PZJ5_CAEEX|nr:hypothetical protein CEXT_250941 [Caerostris extrusa]